MGLDSTEYARASAGESDAPGTITWERVSGTGPARIVAEYQGRLLRSLSAAVPSLDTADLFRDPESPSIPLPAAIFFNVLPILAATLFAVRNLRLGRGDRRGATLFALVVFVAYMLESILHLSLESLDISQIVSRMTGENPIGHALYHAAFVWVGYLALEPYLRKARPTTLVSWARLVGRRWRDPILGRDVLAGLAGGAVLMLVWLGLSLVLRSTEGLDMLRSASWGDLTAVSRPSNALSQVFYSVAFAPPVVMLFLVLYLGLLVVVRRDRIAMGLLALIPAVLGSLGGGGVPIWFSATLGLVAGVVIITTIFRYGVFAGAVLFFGMLLASSLPWGIAPGAWYGGIAALGPVLLSLLAVWAAFTAMGGQMSVGSVLGDDPHRPS
jgi:hypothetical protein